MYDLTSIIIAVVVGIIFYNIVSIKPEDIQIKVKNNAKNS